MDGIINLWKPTGITSHDAVYKVRRALSVKRVGHTGTLDPLAEGVLPICVGKATKLADYIAADRKTYIATMRFGIETDTQDITGDVISRCDKQVTEEELCKAKASFTGDIMQVPPMYSAVHHKGRRLYELAREGIIVERQPRPVTIHSITVNSFCGSEAEIEVECSKGTYIRTLCHDIGKHLGTVATMARLIRTKSGVFSTDTAITLETLEKEGEHHLIPPDKFFEDLRKFIISASDEKKVRCGMQIKTNAPKGERVRLYIESGEFLCVSKCTESDKEKYFKMELSFY